jgi:hypothetical protein
MKEKGWAWQDPHIGQGKTSRLGERSICLCVVYHMINSLTIPLRVAEPYQGASWSLVNELG